MFSGMGHSEKKKLTSQISYPLNFIVNCLIMAALKLDSQTMLTKNILVKDNTDYILTILL